MTAPLGALGLSLMLALPGGPATAQSIGDPTRPPAEVIGAAGSGGAAGVPGANPRLQSVLIGTGAAGRKVAVIDGQLLRPGQRFGGALVVGIKPGEVILRRGNKLEKLKLLPSAEGAASVTGKQ